MQYKAEIHVTLKRTVNDPQGLAIRGGLHSLGYETVESVRAGKFIEVWLEAESAEEARRLADEMSDQLLANPVIEDYAIAIADAATS
ncbi:MAG: phosphoribosylformylglycinamidine synthase subunit PurS [Chloroflexi bacterium]|nr:phosphoribosylformylglycinamidine synthase subunit PurS [Chloroflexota bacterium]MCY3697447.1 phosphoribosylformylglycinamidine synthase subunit PurS [Chloroflexota bacterium]MXX33030.1 phosphoribosylformylglycinamidine synthase subunit PurS [Chloroflexota bacterium]MYD15605.1 phosphoribosylformylglycinamidine synthase subunit PurS [Chloroflexota bacterium]MYJ02607.1 phosphoribosylformylglycinamidine synthase subunit PurS [Chloroflexota bacterium]